MHTTNVVFQEKRKMIPRNPKIAILKTNYFTNIFNKTTEGKFNRLHFDSCGYRYILCYYLDGY